MIEKIQALEDNNWIRDCKGTWRSMILHPPKPHQEGVTYIKEFIWSLRISYHELNAVTKSFLFPIPHYTDSVKDFEDSNGMMFFITLDARQD